MLGDVFLLLWFFLVMSLCVLVVAFVAAVLMSCRSDVESERSGTSLPMLLPLRARKCICEPMISNFPLSVEHVKGHGLLHGPFEYRFILFSSSL